MKFKTDDIFQLLNLQYGVCFGFIFSTFFSVGSTGVLQIHLQWVPHFWEFYLLLFYFFLDWGMFNLTKNHLNYKIGEILVTSIGIWALGYVTLLPRSETSLPIGQLLLGIYFLLAGIQRFYFYALKRYYIGDEEMINPASSLAGSILTFFQIGLSLLVILSAASALFFSINPLANDLISFLIYIGLFLAIKLITLAHMHNIFKTD